MEIDDILKSGLLESYVYGAISPLEVATVKRYREDYPEVEAVLRELEREAELLAHQNAIMPPAGTFEAIENEINEIRLREQQLDQRSQERRYRDFTPQPEYLDVTSSSSHMNVHKAWRWAFAAVFLIGKVFLGFAIYYYLENRQLKTQNSELKLELNQVKAK